MRSISARPQRKAPQLLTLPDHDGVHLALYRSMRDRGVRSMITSVTLELEKVEHFSGDRFQLSAYCRWQGSPLGFHHQFLSGDLQSIKNAADALAMTIKQKCG